MAVYNIVNTETGNTLFMLSGVTGFAQAVIKAEEVKVALPMRPEVAVIGNDVFAPERVLLTLPLYITKECE